MAIRGFHRHAAKTISAERPTRWDEVDSFQGPSGQRLREALTALAPISGIEHDCLLANLNFASMARQPMRPLTRSAKAAMLSAEIGPRSKTTVTLLRSRDRKEPPGESADRETSATVMLELADALGGWGNINTRHKGWLWGPAGPPIRDERASEPGGPGTWAAHAAALGKAIDAEAVRAKDKDNYEHVLRSRAIHVSGLHSSGGDMAVLVGQAKTLHHQAAGILHHSKWMRTDDDLHALRSLSSACQATVGVLSDMARSAMQAAAFAGMARAVASRLPDETKALAVIEASGWGEGVIAQWGRDAPTPDLDNPLSWWDLRHPTPAEFWLAAYTTARIEAARAADDDRGVARYLIGRQSAGEDAEEELRAMSAFDRRFPNAQAIAG